MIRMVLKRLFLFEKPHNRLPATPVCDTFKLHQFVQHGITLTRFILDPCSVAVHRFRWL